MKDAPLTHRLVFFAPCVTLLLLRAHRRIPLVPFSQLHSWARLREEEAQAAHAEDEARRQQHVKERRHGSGSAAQMPAQDEQAELEAKLDELSQKGMDYNTLVPESVRELLHPDGQSRGELNATLSQLAEEFTVAGTAAARVCEQAQAGEDCWYVLPQPRQLHAVRIPIPHLHPLTPRADAVNCRRHHVCLCLRPGTTPCTPSRKQRGKSWPVMCLRRSRSKQPKRERRLPTLNTTDKMWRHTAMFVCLR